MDSIYQSSLLQLLMTSINSVAFEVTSTSSKTAAGVSSSGHKTNAASVICQHGEMEVDIQEWSLGRNLKVGDYSGRMEFGVHWLHW